MLTVAEICDRIRRVILNTTEPRQDSPNTAYTDFEKSWTRIKQVLWDALRPFPDARVAMAQALGLLNEAAPT